jgi:phosphatidylinositol alpha-mannosyltransferase
MPVLEAMACGCAIIATRAGCMEVLYNGHNALIVRPGSPTSILRALRLLAHSENRRRTLGMAGITTAAQHSWQKSAKQFEHLICRT